MSEQCISIYKFETILPILVNDNNSNFEIVSDDVSINPRHISAHITWLPKIAIDRFYVNTEEV